MSVGVFGATGFIGRHLSRMLAAKGLPARLFGHRPVDGTVAIDVDDPMTYVEHLRGIKTLILLVGRTIPGLPRNSLELEVSLNVRPYAMLLDIVSTSEVEQVIYLSSGGTVYGVQHGELIAEDHVLEPISYYGLSKVMIEAAMRTASRHSGMTYTILRPSNPVGTGQVPGRVGFLSSVVAAARLQRPVQVWGDGLIVRDYFRVEDLCEAIIACIGNPAAADETFNVGSGRGLSQLDAIGLVERIIGQKIEISFLPRRSVDVPRNVLSVEKIKRQLSWSPIDDLDGAIGSLLRAKE